MVRKQLEQQIIQMQKQNENDEKLADLYYQLANVYFYGIEETKVDYTKALPLYLKAYKCGSIKSCNAIGYIYEKGLGVDVDPKKAFKYYSLSANANDMLGHSNLGVAYYNGVGCERDVKKAFEHIYMSAVLGYTLSQLNVGVMFYNGEGTEKDVIKALYWFEKAAENGNEEAKAYAQKIKNV